MSCWTLKLLEIMIALFYLIHIILKRYLKDLSTLIICLCLHHMIRKYIWLKIMVMLYLQEKYAQIISSLIFWQTVNVLIYITYIVSRLSRYTHNHGFEHCDAIFKLLRYLKGTINFVCHIVIIILYWKDIVMLTEFFDLDEQSLLIAIMCLP